MPSNPFYYDVNSWDCINANYNSSNRESSVSSEVSSDASLAREYYTDSSRKLVSKQFFLSKLYLNNFS